MRSVVSNWRRLFGELGTIVFHVGSFVKIMRFFSNLREQLTFALVKPSFVPHWVRGGVYALGLAFLCFWYWDDLWANTEPIRNLAVVAAAALGLPIAIWRSYTAHRQAATAQDSLLNERYQRAAEMLGGDLAVRLAGIHALARMAQEHPLSYHVLIMSALSAVARASAKRQDAPGRKQMPEDVTVIMEVLAERSHKQLLMELWEGYKFDLRAVDLRGSSLTEVDLGRAILDDAVLSDADNPTGFWNAEFQSASFVSASLDHAYFVDADLSGADLSNAKLTSTELTRTEFRVANLTDADFSDSKFQEVDIEGALLEGTNLTNVTGLTQQQLNAAQIDSSRPPILAGAADPDTGKPLEVPA